MDNHMEKQTTETAAEENLYIPRPAWQVWCARIGLVLFLIVVISQILRIARGGL